MKEILAGPYLITFPLCSSLSFATNAEATSTATANWPLQQQSRRHCSRLEECTISSCHLFDRSLVPLFIECRRLNQFCWLPCCHPTGSLLEYRPPETLGLLLRVRPKSLPLTPGDLTTSCDCCERAKRVITTSSTLLRSLTCHRLLSTIIILVDQVLPGFALGSSFSKQ